MPVVGNTFHRAAGYVLAGLGARTYGRSETERQERTKRKFSIFKRAPPCSAINDQGQDKLHATWNPHADDSGTPKYHQSGS